MNNENQPPSLPAVPDTKEEEKVLPAFYCLKCRNTFREIEGKQYRDGDVAQWCPHCGASDDHIYELSEQEQAGMFIPPVLEEPGAVEATAVQGPTALLNVVKAAYLKHHCGLDNVGWEQLSNMMCDALCNAMGDVEFRRWLEENTR